MNGKLCFILLLALLTFGIWRVDPSAARAAVQQARSNRDQDLFQTAIAEILEGRYREGRTDIGALMEGHPGSPFIKAARLALADSFYLEGGSKNLAQAESAYREWLQFFPDDGLDYAVRQKIAEIYMLQIFGYDHDLTYARKAETELKDILRLHPETAAKAGVENRIDEVQEILAMHELNVARFYYEERESAVAARARTEVILNMYPHFSKMDAALYYHALATADQGHTATAVRDLRRLLESHPDSTYAGEARIMLERLEKPVPETRPAGERQPGRTAPNIAASDDPSLMESPIQGLSTRGVLIERNLTPNEIVTMARQISSATARQ